MAGRNLRLPFIAKQDKERFWARVQVGKPNECWNWQAGKNPNNYGLISLGMGIRSCRSHSFLAHRVAYYLSTGVDPDTLCVLHKCDNPPCCNPRHLFLGTRADNCQDMYTKGRNFIHPNSRDQEQRPKRKYPKYTADTVRKVRHMYNEGLSSIRISKLLNMAPTTVFNMVHRITWKYLK
jgi:hypothetical protein